MKDAKKNILASAIAAQAWNATKSAKNVEQWLVSAINTANTTPYDKAIDSIYLNSHIGGAQLHHLLDGQHDVIGAFRAASDALPDDSIFSEIFGTASHLLKDLFSVSGLPIVSLDPNAYKQGSTWVSEHLGISKSWQGDLLQINALELLGGSLCIASSIFALKKGDKELLSEIGTSSLISGIVCANPIALVASIVAIAYSIKSKSNKGDFIGGICKGAGGTGSVLAVGTICAPFVSGVIGSIFLLVTSIVLAGLVRNFIGRTFSGRKSQDIENERLWNEYIRSEEEKIKKKFSPELVEALRKSTS